MSRRGGMRRTQKMQLLGRSQAAGTRGGEMLQLVQCERCGGRLEGAVAEDRQGACCMRRASRRPGGAARFEQRRLERCGMWPGGWARRCNDSPGIAWLGWLGVAGLAGVTPRRCFLFKFFSSCCSTSFLFLLFRFFSFVLEFSFHLERHLQKTRRSCNRCSGNEASS